MNTMNIPAQKLPSDEHAQSLQRTIDDYRFLESEMVKTKRSNDELLKTNERLIQENAMLRESLEREKRSKDALQAYAVSITTRLSTVVDIVQAAKEDAMRNGAMAQALTVHDVGTGPSASTGSPTLIPENALGLGS